MSTTLIIGDLLKEEVGRIDGGDDNPVLILLEGETEDTLWRGLP